ncbi:TIGR01777 family oxidoreductase [Flavobacterium sp. NG2]|uniref:TIGR01777 family oxidoreductase n=1 Tax=Flavobacterium sp. NG2 TaxID=3097547 RepID=UPI002A8208A6|nr:TIGR01777 family oxidoreductase [Flavobacterium sp. NG2]WPR71049.1 TIGR01777 family oxidoreductase [Flavobacterium sp. NG2]
MVKKNILITGGTGFVGKHLTNLLISKGFSVSVLSRSKRANKESLSYYTWDIDKFIIDEEAVLNADCIIHLAGENIAGKRWTQSRKKAIVDSRVQPVKLIESILKKHNKKLDAFISASGVGIYGGYNKTKICSEERVAATDFLGSTCQKWEAVADEMALYANRIVKVRTGLVLGKGGFLSKILPLFKWRLGSAIGTGKQFMPWIHIDDLCRIYLEAIENPQMNGAYNAAVFDNTTNAIFSKKLAKVLGYKILLPNVPAFMLRILLGEMAVIVLTGQRVSPEKIKKLGFQFQYKDLETAIRNCLK